MLTPETDNLPAVVQHEPTREIARADTDSWVEIMRPVIALADRICDTEFVPKGLRGSAPATAAAMLYGREIGLPPMTALQGTHVIEGKPSISAELMRALILAAGHELEFVESTGAICTMRGRRRGQENWTTVSWTLDMGRAAGLLSKKNWQTYPRDQLVARCTTSIARMIFPDVIHGFRSLEEVEDMDEDGATEPGPAAPSPATTVRRTAKKTAAKKTAPAPLEQRPEQPDGPPLPGEDGYTETSPGGEAPAAPVEPPASPPGDQDDGATDHEPADAVDQGTPGGEGEGEAPEPPGGPAQRGPRLMSRAQGRGIFAALKQLGVDDDDDERHLIVSTILGRQVESFTQLTIDDAKTLLDTFARVENKEQLNTLLDQFDTPA